MAAPPRSTLQHAVAADREHVQAVVVPEEDPGGLLRVEARRQRHDVAVEVDLPLLGAGRRRHDHEEREPGRQAERESRHPAHAHHRSPTGAAGGDGRAAATGVEARAAAETVFGMVTGAWPVGPGGAAGAGGAGVDTVFGTVNVGASPLGPGGAGAPGATGIAGGRHGGLARVPHDLRREEHHQLAPPRLRQVVLEEPAEHRDLREPGDPALVVLEVLLAKAGDDDRSAVGDVGLRDRVPRGHDRRDQERRVDPLDGDLVLHGDREHDAPVAHDARGDLEPRRDVLEADRRLLGALHRRQADDGELRRRWRPSPAGCRPSSGWASRGSGPGAGLPGPGAGCRARSSTRASRALARTGPRRRPGACPAKRGSWRPSSGSRPGPRRSGPVRPAERPGGR